MNEMMWTKRELCWATLALLLALPGCGDGHPEHGQVEGTVMVQGTPLTTGQIRFVPANGRPAMGEIKQDGSYTLTTYEPGDGALLGAHKVTIEAVEITNPTEYSSFEEEVEASQSDRPPPKIGFVKRLVPESYGRVETTDLTANVTSGANRIDFNIEGSIR